MYSHHHIALSLSFLFTFHDLTSSVPTNLPSSSLPSAPIPALIPKLSLPNPETLRIASARNASLPLLNYTTVTYSIPSTTLSLTINIGPWDLSPGKILHTLEAAENTVGKRVPSHLLDREFVQRTGSWINRMVFEIGPGYIYKRLTWADVAEVVGANGLPKFFRENEGWCSIYFEVVDSERGKLGDGALRKWYLLGD